MNTNSVKLTEIEKHTFDSSVEQIENNFRNLLNEKVEFETTQEDIDYITNSMYDNIPSVEDIFSVKFNSSNKKTLGMFEYFVSKFDNELLYTNYERLESTLLEILIDKLVETIDSKDSISSVKQFPFTSREDLQQYLLDSMIKFQPEI